MRKGCMEGHTPRIVDDEAVEDARRRMDAFHAGRGRIGGGCGEADRRSAVRDPSPGGTPPTSSSPCPDQYLFAEITPARTSTLSRPIGRRRFDADRRVALLDRAGGLHTHHETHA